MVEVRGLDGCRVWLRLVGAYRPALGDNECGGMNVSFTGSLTAPADGIGPLREACLAHVRRSRAEDDCIGHAVHADCEDRCGCSSTSAGATWRR